MEAATRELAAWVLSGENAVASVCKGRDLRLAASRCLSVEALQLHIMGYLAVGGEWCCSLVGAEGSGRSGVVQRLADVLRSAAPALRVVRVGGWKRRGSWSSSAAGCERNAGEAAWALWHALSPSNLPETTPEALRNIGTLVERSGARAGLVVALDDLDDAADGPEGLEAFGAFFGGRKLRGVRLVGVQRDSSPPRCARAVYVASRDSLATRLLTHARLREGVAVYNRAGKG